MIHHSKNGRLATVGMVLVAALVVAGSSFAPTGSAGTTMICNGHTDGSTHQCNGSCPHNAKIGVSMNLDDNDEPDAFAQATCDGVGAYCEPPSTGSCQNESTTSTDGGGSMTCNFSSLDPWAPDDGFAYACWHNTPGTAGGLEVPTIVVACQASSADLCGFLGEGLVPADAEGATVVKVEGGVVSGVRCTLDGCVPIQPACAALGEGFACTAYPARVA